MPENKMLCTADEYAYLEETYASFTKKLERMKAVQPDNSIYNAVHDSIPRIEHIVRLYAEALSVFKVKPSSERTGTITLSVEFQENFKKLKTPQVKFTPAS